MARRNEDRLDTICRIFDTIYTAHRGEKEKLVKDCNELDTKYGECLDLMVEMARLIPTEKVSNDLERRLRPYLDINNLPDAVF